MDLLLRVCDRDRVFQAAWLETIMDTAQFVRRDPKLQILPARVFGVTDID